MALKGACASEGPRRLSFISFMVNPPVCIFNSKEDGFALYKEKTRTHTNISVRKPHLEDYCLLECKTS